MPLTKGPALKDKILELRRADVTRSMNDIAKEVGCTISTVKYHLGRQGVSSNPTSKKAEYEPSLIRQVTNLSVRGLSAADIAKELGTSVYSVYDIRKRNEIEKGPKETSVKSTTSEALAVKAMDLKKTGMPTVEIARILKKPTKAVYQMIYYYSKKGATSRNHESNSHNGDAANHNANAPTKAELIGFAWAQVERGVADLAQRTSLPPDILRRRISELLGYSSLR